MIPQKNTLLARVLIFGILAGITLDNILTKTQSYDERRQDVIRDMESLIQEKVDDGEYHCCVTPACDMCFLGHWIWDDGICRCDDMAAKGEEDKVCPQCRNNEEDGTCKAEEEFCPLS